MQILLALLSLDAVGERGGLRVFVLSILVQQSLQDRSGQQGRKEGLSFLSLFIACSLFALDIFGCVFDRRVLKSDLPGRARQDTL